MLFHSEVIQQNGSSHEPQNLGFQPFMITHFSTIVLTFWAGSNKLGCDHIASKLASSTHQVMQIAQSSSVFQQMRPLLLRFREWRSFNYFTYSMLPEINHILPNSEAFMFCEAMLHFYYWYISSSWNQIGILHWNWIPMSTMCYWLWYNDKDWEPTTYFFLCCLTLTMKPIQAFSNWELKHTTI
jgi:hypothetical protein